MNLRSVPESISENRRVPQSISEGLRISQNISEYLIASQSISQHLAASCVHACVCARVCVCVRARACARVCVRVRCVRFGLKESTQTQAQTRTQILRALRAALVSVSFLWASDSGNLNVGAVVVWVCGSVYVGGRGCVRHTCG